MDSDEFNIDDVNTIAGMGFLYNNSNLSNSIHINVEEKKIIEGISNDTSETTFLDNENINPLEEYENKIKEIVGNDDNKNDHFSNDDYERQNEPKSYMDEDFDRSYKTSTKSDFDELESLIKSVDTNSNECKSDYNMDLYKVNNEERESKKIINNIIHDKKNNDIIEENNEEYEKLKYLDQIDNLRDDLLSDGINISKVPSVNHDSPIEEIKRIYTILTIKNCRDKYREFGEEIILSASSGLEYLFDGEKEYFGYTPDLTGYSDTLKIKLRRLRYETTTIVSNIMEKYEMDPMTKFMASIVPSMIMHSAMRKKHYNLKNNIYSDIRNNN